MDEKRERIIRYKAKLAEWDSGVGAKGVASEGLEAKMTFHEILKKEALKFAEENAIVKHGETVTTSWGGWVKPHKVKIYLIGACLSCGKFNKKTKEFYAELEMFYFARRLKVDGTIKPQDKNSGIVLTAFIKSDGTAWKQKTNTVNHAAYYWCLPMQPVSSAK